MKSGVSYISKRYSKANNNNLASCDTKKRQLKLYNSTQMIYVVMLSLNFFQQVDLNG